MNIRKRLNNDGKVAAFFLLPSLFGFSLFYLIPFVMGTIYSFKDGAVGGSFVGLFNYKELLASSSFLRAASNTFWFTAINVPLVIGISLLLALCLHQKVLFKNVIISSFILPIVVPVASIVMLWQILFDWNGIFNSWLVNLGFTQVDWMNSDWSIAVVSIVYLWKNIGYNLILFLAGLQNIPKDYYEIADLEGAGRLFKFRQVTLVYLTPTMFFVFLMSTINSFKVFRETYLIAGDYPYDRIYTIQHYMNNMFTSLNVQKLTAAASLMVLCILILVLVFFAIESRYRKFMN
ncbi:carbohydrate ABC transporter permease [Gottfriedia acidiceleris]|uniref:carbohydrate ABC transporter permease n=1 Tax=Gottfriedia acidiceleris TaxID=371036 RepID=UPI000B43C992|nr:sugar ABC transporter permease [Gottfriedia acidiceleris]